MVWKHTFISTSFPNPATRRVKSKPGYQYQGGHINLQGEKEGERGPQRARGITLWKMDRQIEEQVCWGFCFLSNGKCLQRERGKIKPRKAQESEIPAASEGQGAGVLKQEECLEVYKRGN